MTSRTSKTAINPDTPDMGMMCRVAEKAASQNKATTMAITEYMIPLTVAIIIAYGKGATDFTIFFN
jgi:hypothetical protein